MYDIWENTKLQGHISDWVARTGDRRKGLTANGHEGLSGVMEMLSTFTVIWSHDDTYV